MVYLSFFGRSDGMVKHEVESGWVKWDLWARNGLMRQYIFLSFVFFSQMCVREGERRRRENNEGLMLDGR